MTQEVSTTSPPQVPAKATPMAVFRGTLTQLRDEITSALPAQIPADKFIRTAMTCVQMNPGLLEADRRSLIASCMKAAQDGLFPDGREAALVMFGKMVQYMPMVAGLLKKARNSGEIKTLSAHVVYEKDSFDYALGDNEFIVHKPYLGGDRGEPVLAYAIAKTKDGGVYREVMDKMEIEKVRKVSRASGKGPWVEWWSEMAKKTVLRRLSKHLPASSDLIGQDDTLPEQRVIEGQTQKVIQSPTERLTGPEPTPEPAPEALPESTGDSLDAFERGTEVQL